MKIISRKWHPHSFFSGGISRVGDSDDNSRRIVNTSQRKVNPLLNKFDLNVVKSGRKE